MNVAKRKEVDVANNQLTLKISPADSNSASLVAELFVNDRRLAPNAVVDLHVLAKSAQTSGNHWIFTCGCGMPMCAGIDEPIGVIHSFDKIEWLFKRIDSLGRGFDLTDEQYENENISEHFQFDPDQYQIAVDRGLRDARLGLDSSKDARLPDIDFTAQNISGLSTRLFTERDCFPDRRTIANEFVLRATDGMWITADGVPFDIEQLSLTSELVQQYRHFESLECFPHTSSDLTRYENFLDAGRKFGRALKRCLGGERKVKLWYRYGPAGNADVWSVTEELR